MSARREAAAELGEVLRRLTDAAVSTEVPTAALHDVTARLREVLPELTAVRRKPGEAAAVDRDGPPQRVYNLVVGQGNPMSPPMTVELVDGAAIGTVELGLAYEGPPSYVHGGVSATLLDQILGHAHAAWFGRPAMTAKLAMRYRAPVPLATPLRIVGRVLDGDPGQRWTSSVGTIATAAEPDVVLVEAEGNFVLPTAEQARRLFGAMEEEQLVGEAF
ncbi:PaaI family thioesterase [Saccharopolyspora cebuensis]|uniref:PaaI family thioesterase n=1 Tax=Saccharopolyspora cebuensis TaxID=418759 RepID=UPI0031F06E9D